MKINKKLGISILIAVLAAIFASQHPDGLDKVSELLGFSEKGIDHISLLTGYNVKFLGESTISTIAAGIIGVFITYGLFSLIIFMTKKHKN